MPQAPRKDGSQVQRAQDKESKRARGALSCAECRRLKLKCDKTVPCSSCIRRGCSQICPNGSLITGQGTRFVLADTERLHEKISLMSDRIRELELALATAHESPPGGPEPHPLLHRDLLNIKSSIDLHSASAINDNTKASVLAEEDSEIFDTFGTLAIRDDGASTFYGRSAGSESLLIGESSTTPPPEDDDSSPHLSSESPSYPDYNSPSSYVQSSNNDLRQQPSKHEGREAPGSIAGLAAVFPMAPSIYTLSSAPSSALSPLSFVSSPNGTSQRITLQDLIAHLPLYAEASRLVQLYLEQAPWFFGAVTRKQIEDEILPLWYDEAPGSNVATPPGGLVTNTGSANGSPAGSIGRQDRAKSSHDLALLFVIFCFGVLTDTNEPPPPDNPSAERYFQLTKAALTVDPSSPTASFKPSRNGLLERPPSVSTVQTLSMMGIYEGMCGGENSIESTWAFMGLSCKLAQSIGLHRDCARWKLTPAEVQKRRAFFWELFITDCWQSLATGRLATFSLPFVDCELPADPDQTMAADGSFQPSFAAWKARWGAECVSAVVQGTLTSRAPKHSIIVELDRKVRDIELPLYAQGTAPQGLGLAQTMSHFMPQNYRELTLLYIHRCFFAHALTTYPMDPMKSPYALSFLTGYRSACAIIASLKAQFELFPAQIARFWVLWTHAFSGAVMLSQIPRHCPRANIAAAAMLEFKNACDLFEAAAPYGGRAVKFLPLLKNYLLKAQQSFRESNNGLPPKVLIRGDIFKPSKSDDKKDELSIFSGKTHTISTKSGSQQASSSTPGAMNSISLSGRSSNKSSPRAKSDSPQQVFVNNPSFAGAHPSLASEFDSYQRHVEAQIEIAARSGAELFLGAPMVVDSGPEPSSGPSTISPHGQHQLQHRPSHPHLVNQHMMQPQQQALYQHGSHKQSRHEMLERQKAEVERKDRQELEKQELVAKQQMEQQYRQQELQKQYQQQEIQRQYETQLSPPHLQQSATSHQKQQRPEDYQRQRQEYRQQSGGQQEQHMGHYRQSYDVETQQPVYGSAHMIPATSTHAAQLQRRPSQPQLSPASQQSYQQQPQQHYRSSQMPQSASLSHSSPAYPSQHAHTISREQQQMGVSEAPTYQPIAPQQQHSMYAIPPEYQSPESIHTGTSSIGYVPLPPTSYAQPSVPSTPATVYDQDRYNQLPGSQQFAMPDQQPTMTYAATAGPSHHRQYTADSFFRANDFAAEDRGLQETWQLFMNKVGAPQFPED